MGIKKNLSFLLRLVLILSTESVFKGAWGAGPDAQFEVGPQNSRTGGTADRTSGENFIVVDDLVDGEQERRLWFLGIAGKETSIAQGESKSLTLLQLVKGYEFLQLIYMNSDELIDCEHVRQRDLSDDFLQKFFHEVDIGRSQNFSSLPYKPRRKSLISNHEFREFLEDDVIPDEYFDLAEMKPVDNVFEGKNMRYTSIASIQDVPPDMRRWLNFNELKMQCAVRHKQMKSLLEKMKSNDTEIRQNALENIHRKKRALSDWLIAPNTKWCGRGHNASKYSQLGGASRADKCCRKHDHCRLFIPGLTTKWHLFNYRPFTLSYCKCDARFRTCLKMADSPDANMVGKLFFNIVQTKCFVLKSEKVCKRRSWWGKCEERMLRKRAHIRNNRQF